MNRQILALIGCVLANVVDGFDIMAIAFTGSAIMAQWGLTPTTLGVIFGAGTVGMVIGSILVAPLADRFGRRTVSLICMLTLAIGMFASAFAQNPLQLIILRVLTGIGIGAMLATMTTIVAEIAPPARRNLILSIFSAGYPIGTMIGGLASVALLSSHGWPIIYIIGGGITALAFFMNAAFLPEPSAPTERLSLDLDFMRRLLRPDIRAAAISISVIFFLYMLSFSFIVDWTPKLMELIGLSRDNGNLAATIMNVGSLAGAFLFGYLADKFGLIRMARAYFVGFTIAVAAFIVAPSFPSAIPILAIFIGVCMAGAMTSIYAMTPVIFPKEIRAGGTGIAIGIGRIGGALGPYFTGVALTANTPLHIIYGFYAIPSLIIALMLYARWAARIDAAGVREL